MISEAINKYLRENGIKQVFLSERSGLTHQCINSALNGKRKLSVDEYAQICLALKLPYDYFFNNFKSA